MSKNEEDHIADLKETFANLKEAGLKLNLEKCIFGVSIGKMLGYIIGPKGIWANPEKTKAIILMVEPSTKKEVQKLIGRIAALKRFISKSAEHSLSFFKALRGGVSHPVFQRIPSANYICAQDVHTTHIATNMENIKNNAFTP